MGGMEIMNFQEICRILGNPGMAEAGCFWVFDVRGTASQIRHKNFMNVFEELNGYLGNNAIWIRELEKYSPSLRAYCEAVNSVNCHMIISPKDSIVLSRHYDIWNVYIRMLCGSRRYEVEGKDIVLSKGQTLLIKKGEMHQVFPIEPSITINFGIEKEPVKFEPLISPYKDHPYSFAALFEDNAFLSSFKEALL